jgi:23S rRNA (adenine2503-C2)-methyltransferase
MSFYGYLPSEIDDLIAELGVPKYRADQLLKSLYHESPAALVDVKQLPAGLRNRLVDRVGALLLPEVVARTESDDGNTTKLLLKFEDGTLIETVLMQYPEPGKHPRSSVCISTQAGCAMGCRFCATGQMGFERNLSAAEIVVQVVMMQQSLASSDQHITNVVFMGMGEPLANYEATSRAIRILTDPRGLGLSRRNITVSTVGVVRGIDRLALEHLGVTLAISLHAPNDQLRRKLVPTASPTSVQDLMDAARRYFRNTGRRVSIEYALIRDVNDSIARAIELAKLLGRTGMHVNLIPVNPTAGGFQRPSRSRVLAFQHVLTDAGLNCTVRAERGVEIAAGCGQLRTTIDAETLAPVNGGEHSE